MHSLTSLKPRYQQGHHVPPGSSKDSLSSCLDWGQDSGTSACCPCVCRGHSVILSFPPTPSRSRTICFLLYLLIKIMNVQNWVGLWGYSATNPESQWGTVGFGVQQLTWSGVAVVGTVGAGTQAPTFLHSSLKPSCQKWSETLPSLQVALLSVSPDSFQVNLFW